MFCVISSRGRKITKKNYSLARKMKVSGFGRDVLGSGLLNCPLWGGGVGLLKLKAAGISGH